MDTLNEIANGTQNDVIVFSVVLVVALILVMVPVYRMMLGSRKEKREEENARRANELDEKKLILSVVTSNTEVMSQLRSTMENLGINTNASLSRIHKRIDEIHTMQVELRGKRNGPGG